MKQLFLLAFLFASLQVQAQNEREFFQFKQQADSFFSAHDFGNASLYFQKALDVPTRESIKGTVRYQASQAFAMNNDKKKAFQCLDFLTSDKNEYKYRFNMDVEVYQSDSLFRNLHSSRKWNKHLLRADDKSKRITFSLDSSIIKEIELIGQRDQIYRRKISSVREEFGSESKEMIELDSMITVNDSINFKRIDQLIDSLGWLGMDVIGSACFDLFLVVQHMNLERQVKYLPMLQKSEEEFNFYSGCRMMLEDRISLRLTGFQLYGSQFCRDLETEEFYFCPILEPEKLDERRFEIGLGPFSEEVNGWSMTWDPLEYKAKLPHYVEVYQRDRKE